jgi:tetratricopeptide (TPR) repeat protein
MWFAREQPDEWYEEAFHGAGLGQIHDDPKVVVDRVRASNIRNALMDALDHWSSCSMSPRLKDWVLAVARMADPDPTGWRVRARDPLIRADEAALVEVVKTAPVADQSVPLLLALDGQLKPNSKERLPFLKRIQKAHPDDFWANLTLGEVLHQERQPGEAIRYLQAAVSIRPRTGYTYHKLGLSLLALVRMEEAVEYLRQAVDLDPTSVPSHHLIFRVLSNQGRHDEAINHLQRAIRFNPTAATLYTALGDSLQIKGRHAEALSQRRQAVALDPKNKNEQRKLRATLLQLGRADEARAAWGKALEDNPPEHDVWYGYAEFCLFIGQEDEYLRARQTLLSRFGTSTDPIVADRTARACLLLPATEDELRQTVALAERAAAIGRTRYKAIVSYFQFTLGLAEYRQGQFDRAITAMRGDASRVLGPAPRLVLAMALHRSGQASEARKTLAEAILAYDWRANQASNQSSWVFHAFRREAEHLIVPNLPAFLEGKYQPEDNDERLALLGVCQFTNRYRALSRLYADAFAAAPVLAEDLRAGHRYHAAFAAALTGCGRGDAADIGETERSRWRKQAREWLLADLAACGRTLDHDPAAARSVVQRVLTNWREDPDLTCLRDPSELDRLAGDERKDWLALWAEVGAVFARTGK